MDFWQRMRGALDRGVDTSKELFGKARDRAQDLSRTGVLKFELMQLEDQLEKQLAKLGHSAYDILKDGGTPVTLDNRDVQAIYEEISSLRESITKKEAQIKAVGEDSSSDK